MIRYFANYSYVKSLTSKLFSISLNSKKCFSSSPNYFGMFRTQELNHSSNPIYNTSRSIFVIRSSDMLWEGVTGAPGKAKKRARGKRRVIRKRVDLNMGRSLGEIKGDYMWPGLQLPIELRVQSGTSKKMKYPKEVEAKEGPMEIKDKKQARVFELRDQQVRRKRNYTNIPPLKRGWSGFRMGGQSLGPPKMTSDQSWDGFDSYVLELKVVTNMTSVKGRVRRFSALVMVGDGKGLVGLGKGGSENMRTAMALAKMRATHNLEYFELSESRTIYHIDYLKKHCSKIYMEPRPENFGIVTHRVIKNICLLVGIKDIYVKVEGNTKNYQMITDIFLELLRRQENYQSLADRLKLNIVEQNNRRDNFPIVLAKPTTPVDDVKPLPSNINYDNIHLDGNVYWRKSSLPSYMLTDEYKKLCKKKNRFRNLDYVGRRNEVLNILSKNAK